MTVSLYGRIMVFLLGDTALSPLSVGLSVEEQHHFFFLRIFTTKDDSSGFVGGYKRLFIFIVWLPCGEWNTKAKEQRIDYHCFSLVLVISMVLVLWIHMADFKLSEISQHYYDIMSSRDLHDLHLLH